MLVCYNNIVISVSVANEQEAAINNEATVIVCVTDNPELDAPLPAAVPRGGGSVAAGLLAGPAHRELQDVLVRGDAFHRSHGVPEPPDHPAEDREQPVREGLPRLRAGRVRG